MQRLRRPLLGIFAAQILYLVFASIAVGTSFAIDQRVDKLKESAL